MTRHPVVMFEADANTYGVTYRSALVYTTSASSSPTRVVIWDNTNRPNPRNGEPVRFGQCGPIDGGCGQYLDPSNRATDDATTVLLSPESSVITNNGTNTGTVASGQVFAEAEPIRNGDVLLLLFPNGKGMLRTVCLTNNGHGVAVPVTHD